MSGGRLRARVSGVGVFGPGLVGWPAASAVLRGERPWRDEAVPPPVPALLGPAERRRTGVAVRIALAAATEAAGAEAASVDTVFASSNGDGAVVGAILEALSRPDGVVSPTQFHNSVHNAAAGYWGIGAGSTRASVSLGGYDGAFAAGLLSALAAVAARGRTVLLCASDAPLPPPLDAVRPTGCAFAAALLLRPDGGGADGALLEAEYRDGAADLARAAEGPESLAAGNPAAAALPLLRALARGDAASLPLPLLPDAQLRLRVRPC